MQSGFYGKSEGGKEGGSLFLVLSQAFFHSVERPALV